MANQKEHISREGTEVGSVFMKTVLMAFSEPGQFWLPVKVVCVVLITAWANWPGYKFQTLVQYMNA